MIIHRDLAIKLESLLDPEIESAFLLLLDDILRQETLTLTDSEAKDSDLRLYQGKYQLIDSLKHYKQRILDAIKNGKSGN